MSAASRDDEASTDPGGGALCISIDLERGWGIWDIPDADYFDQCRQREEAIVERLLDMFVELDVRATWAVVGQLLSRDDGISPAHDALWRAPEDVQRILDVDPAQDIGSHSFGHVYYPTCSREEVVEDLALAAAAHQAAGLGAITSFVFPRNLVGHLDVLAATDVKVFRSTDQGLHTTIRDRFGHLAGRVANLVDKAVPSAAPPVQPVRHENGLVELPSSMLLMGRDGPRGLIPPDIVVAKARRSLDAAASEGGLFHLWFHPSNFYVDGDRQFAVLRSVLEHARSLEDRGLLRITTMADFAAAPSARA